MHYIYNVNTVETAIRRPIDRVAPYAMPSQNAPGREWSFRITPAAEQLRTSRCIADPIANFGMIAAAKLEDQKGSASLPVARGEAHRVCAAVAGRLLVLLRKYHFRSD